MRSRARATSSASFDRLASVPAAGRLRLLCHEGRGLDYRHTGAAFTAAVKRAGISVSGRLSLHSLRHGYASLLIAQRLNVVFVSRQLGHANPNITLEVYAHLFERADHDTTARDALEASYAAMAVGGQQAN